MRPPGPVPPDVIVTQGTLLTAVHAQEAGVDTVTEPVLVATGALAVVGFRLYVQAA